MGVPLMNYRSISSIVLVEEAKKLGLEVDIISKDKNLFYIKGNGKEFLFKSVDFCGINGISGNSAVGLKISDDKELTYKILEKYNLPIAKTWYIQKNEINEIEKLDIIFPVIIKPIEEGHGDGVMMNILNIVELKEKLEKSFKKYDKMIIQKQITGDEYRIIVLKGEVILAINRIPASIIGNGKNSIKELIEIENQSNPLRGNGYNEPLAYINTDNELVDYIKKKGYNLDYKPKNKERLQIRSNSNIGTGGTMLDVTKILSQDIIENTIKSANILGLEICGVDVITNDITKSLSETGGIILEINSCPGIGGHRELTSVNVGEVILKKLFF